MVLTEPGMLRAASMFDCHIELLPSAAGPINRRRRIRFHVGTAEIMGYVLLLEDDRLEPGGSGMVQIRLEEPVAAFPGDRFYCSTVFSHDHDRRAEKSWKPIRRSIGCGTVVSTSGWGFLRSGRLEID